MNIKNAAAGGVALSAGLGLVDLRAADEGDRDKRPFTTTFGVAAGELLPSGRNPHFILEPGYELYFEGREDGKPVTLTITVLNETRTIDGVVTRVVEERETKAGKVVEVSRNFFALSKRTNDVYYFGEEVDIFRDGRVVFHEGAWESGKDRAKFGLAMPGSPLLGARYYQETAPGKAMDRAEVVGRSETLDTPAGRFTSVLRTEETTPLEPDEREAKYSAFGVGLIKDGPMKLVRLGVAPAAK